MPETMRTPAEDGKRLDQARGEPCRRLARCSHRRVIAELEANIHQSPRASPEWVTAALVR